MSYVVYKLEIFQAVLRVKKSADAIWKQFLRVNVHVQCVIIFPNILVFCGHIISKTDAQFF